MPTRPRRPPLDAATAEPRADDAPLGQPIVDPDAADPAPTGVRPAVRDGDGEPQLEPEPVTDGVPDEQDDYRNPDGADPVQWDSRLPQDSEPFERPPAGHDVQAFAVELEPLADRRTTALFRFEPWQPRGIRVGTFTLFPTVDLGAAWLSNVFRSKPARSDAALEFRPTLRAVSNWRVHALELRATGNLSQFNEFPRESDRAYALEARGRLDITRRTSASAGVLREVVQEPRGTLESRLRGGARADVTTNEARLQVDHRFNRLSVQLRGLVQDRTFEDTRDGSAVVSNRDRNRMATEETARVAYAFKPSLAVFGEAGINQRRFEAAPADGLRRDSDGERYRVGVSFGTTSQVLRGEASIGYGRQSPLDGRLPAIAGVLIDANLAWRVTALTSVLLSGSTDVVETTTPQSGGGLNRRVQAEVRHAFMRPLIGTASLGFSSTAYEGISLTENAVEMALGAEYYLSPNAVIFGRYQHALLRSSRSTAEWDADEVRIGVRLRQ